MSKEELTYEELQQKVGSLSTKFDKFIKIAQETKDENEDKNHEAKHNNDNDKNRDAQNNDKEDKDEKMSNLIANIRTAQDMKDDDEDKKEAMKKAIEELEDYDKLTSKKGQNDKDKDEDADEDKKEMESKIASLENKTKEPLVKEILKVASIVNPKGIKQITRELKTASLQDVEELYKHYKPFSASLGITEGHTATQSPRSIPFQLNAALENEIDDDDVLSASTRKEYAKIDTEKLYERVTEMYT